MVCCSLKECICEFATPAPHSTKSFLPARPDYKAARNARSSCWQTEMQQRYLVLHCMLVLCANSAIHRLHRRYCFPGGDFPYALPHFSSCTETCHGFASCSVQSGITNSVKTQLQVWELMHCPTSQYSTLARTSRAGWVKVNMLRCQAIKCHARADG